MSVVFEQHTGITGTALTTANPTGFVAALNVTFIVAAALSLLALTTSLLGGGRKVSSADV